MTPKAAGHYWARWKIKSPGTAEEDDPPSGQWEVVQVFENCIDETDDEYLMVAVPGVERSQSLDNFFWGDRVPEPKNGRSSERTEAIIREQKMSWQPIDTCNIPQRLGVIVAVPGSDGSWIVGEANTHEVDGEHVWYWAGNGPGDYHGGPIVEINHGPPKFWQPLPDAPDGPSS